MSSGSRKKRQSVNQTVGGIMFGFEQQVLRSTPPAEELVQHARPDAPVAAADGELLTLELPEAADLDDPWAGIEDELAEDDPWSDYAAEPPAEGSAAPGSEAATEADGGAER